MSDLAQRTPQQEIVATIRSDNFREQYEALHTGVPLETFARNFQTALMEDEQRQTDPAKRLTACDRGSLFTALLKCGADGLIPDGRQAAIVKRGKYAVYMVMRDGLTYTVGKYGWSIRGYAIHTNDQFAYTIGERPQHQPPPISEPRGEVIGSWAEATYRDGRRSYLVITPEELAKRRAMATTDNIWRGWTAQQAEKTAVRDLCKRLDEIDDEGKARIERIHDIIDQTSEERVAALYGTTDVHELPGSPRVAAPPAGGELAGDAEAEALGEVGAAADPPPATADDDEPGLTEPAEGEETVETFQALALAAADYVPPTGKFSAGGTHGPKTIREIVDLGTAGAKWLGWALGKRDLTDEYTSAVWNFARVFAPAMYQEALAKRELA